MPKKPIWKQKYLEASKILAEESDDFYDEKPVSKKRGPYRREKVLPGLEKLKRSWKRNVGKFSVKVNTECHHLEGCNNKIIYYLPVGSKKQKVLVKPYNGSCEFGWAEQTAQRAFHAAGLGKYVQKSFVAMHGDGKRRVPVTVIKMEPGYTEICDQYNKSVRSTPGFLRAMRRIAILDFLLDNQDRHGSNLMFKNYKTTSKPLAIDNGLCMCPDSRKSSFDTEFRPHDNEAYEHFDAGPIEDYHKEIKKWWPTVSKKVIEVVEERIKMLVDSGFDDFELEYEGWRELFTTRVKVLDEIVKSETKPVPVPLSAQTEMFLGNPPCPV